MVVDSVGLFTFGNNAESVSLRVGELTIGCDVTKLNIAMAMSLTAGS
jgi:hypothetical protein